MRSSTRWLICFSIIILSTAAVAQQRIVFDIDDYIDPGEHPGPVFISRLIAGGATNFINGYRPLRKDVGFVQIANSLYFSHFQFDYKHTELQGGSADLRLCACRPPVYFPTPPPDNAIPDAPPPGAMDLLQIAWYRHTTGTRNIPVALRYRLSIGRDSFKKSIRSLVSNDVISHLSGHEQSFGIDADTYVRIRGREMFGSFAYHRTAQSGTNDGRSQHELTYANRFAPIVTKWFLVHTTLTVGAVSDRGGTVLNVVSPQFEAVWHHDATDLYVHLVYSPQLLNSGAEGWQTHHQIALFADRALIVKLFH